MSSTVIAQLTCQQCHSRKKKCDKAVPCAACVKADLECTPVQRSRLPRGRSGNSKASVRSSALKDRVGRLEGLILKLQESQAGQQEGSIDNQRPPGWVVSDPTIGLVASSFWGELGDAVAGVRGALEGDDDEVEDKDEDDGHADDKTSNDAHGMLFGMDEGSVSPHVLTDDDMSQEMKAWLLDIYRDRVDAIFKATHWPTTYVQIKSPVPTSPCDSADLMALESAVYFTSTCSLMDHEVPQRPKLVASLRSVTEQAFARAGLMSTTSFTVLQAFVIYLAGLRASQANAQQWTLTATAIRIASAQGIPDHAHRATTTFQQELQRRLWFSIGILDMQSAFDRGSRPLLRSEDFQILPLGVDDADMQSSFRGPMRGLQTSAANDMLFSLTTYRAMVCQLKLVEIGCARSLNQSTAMAEQTRALTQFEDHVKSLRSTSSQMQSSLERFTMMVAEASLVSIRLLVYRPLHPRRFSPPNESNINVLVTATEVLERTQEKRSFHEFQQWAWYSWVKWYALAIVLAELCTVKGSQADRAWRAAKLAFEDYKSIVADTRSGLLWKPIAKLMRRVREVRGVEDGGISWRGPTVECEPCETLTEMDTNDDASLFYWDELINDIMFNEGLDRDF